MTLGSRPLLRLHIKRVRSMRYSTGLAVVALVTLALFFPGVCFSAIPSGAVSLRGELVTVRAREMPLLTLLQQISEATGTEIYLFCPAGSKRVTVEFTDRPLESALGTILKGCSYAVVSGDEGRLKGAVYLMVARGDAGVGQREWAGASGGEAAQGDYGQPGSGAVAEASGWSPDGSEVGTPEGPPAKGQGRGGGPGVQSPTASAPRPAGSTAGQAAREGAFSPQARLERMIQELEQRIASGASDRDFDMYVKNGADPRYLVHDRERVDSLKQRLRGLKGG